MSDPFKVGDQVIAHGEGWSRPGSVVFVTPDGARTFKGKYATLIYEVHFPDNGDVFWFAENELRLAGS